MVSNSWREITHFWYLGWPEKGVPSEANSLIAFIIEARSYMKNGTLDKVCWYTSYYGSWTKLVIL